MTIITVLNLFGKNKQMKYSIAKKSFANNSKSYMSHTVNRLAADKFIKITSWKYKFEARTLHHIMFSIKSKHMHTESIIHWGNGVQRRINYSLEHIKAIEN